MVVAPVATALGDAATGEERIEGRRRVPVLAQSLDVRELDLELIAVGL